MPNLVLVSSLNQSQLSAPVVKRIDDDEKTQEPSQAKTCQVPFDLTVREVAVVVVLFTMPGATYKHVAARLSIPFGTLKSRLYSIYQKLGAENQFEALQKLSKNGFEAQSYLWTLPSLITPQEQTELEPISA
jgi:DNA-binding NarL/FixJ family response regulator